MNIRGIQPGQFHHIYNRGNRKENIAWDDEDKDFYLGLIFELFKTFKETLVAYCFLDNHYHLIARAEDPKSLSGLMRSFGIRGAIYYNNKYKSVGHLYQGRYQIKVVDGLIYQTYLSKYVHLNPLNLDYIDSIEDQLDYKWSSLPYYINDNRMVESDCESFFKPELILNKFKSKSAYLEYLMADNFAEEMSFVNHPKQEIDKEIREMIIRYKLGDALPTSEVKDEPRK